MKLSINKLLIGLLFVFSFILIPTDVAKANSYSVSCDTENYQGQWVDFDLNVSPVSDLMAAEAFGGVTSGSGAYYDGRHCPYDISVTAHTDEDSREKTIFSGYIPQNPSGSMVFLFNTKGIHTIVFSGYVDSNMPRQIGPISMDVYVVPPALPDPVVTVSASPSSVASGNSSTISWTATNNPTSCIRTDTRASVDINGSFNTGPLYSTTTFTISCSN